MHLKFTTCATVFGLWGCGPGESSFTKKEDDPIPAAGDSIMEVSNTELTWSDMEVGQTYSKEFTIESVGEVDLQFYEARILTGGDTFYLPEVWKNDQTLSKGQSITMTLTAALQEDAMREGSMRIKSNDSNSVELLIPLIAAPVGWEGSTDTGASEEDSGGSTTD